MTKQSRLESKAINKRKELVVKNDYIQGQDTEYSGNHKDALSDGDPLGKGTGVSIGVAGLPGVTESTAINYSTMDTSRGGGQYDIEGKNGISGRDRLIKSNLYMEGNEYGPESVDTSANVAEGQIVIQ